MYMDTACTCVIHQIFTEKISRPTHDMKKLNLPKLIASSKVWLILFFSKLILVEIVSFNISWPENFMTYDGNNYTHMYLPLQHECHTSPKRPLDIHLRHLQECLGDREIHQSQSNQAQGREEKVGERHKQQVQVGKEKETYFKQKIASSPSSLTSCKT